MQSIKSQKQVQTLFKKRRKTNKVLSVVSRNELSNGSVCVCVCVCVCV